MVSGQDESADRPEPGESKGSEGEFGPSLGDFGPSINEFGPTPAPAAPGWSPAPGPQGPDVAWRPAGGQVPPPPPQYRAPDAWAPTTGQYPAQYPTGQYPPVNGMSTGQFAPVEGAGQQSGTPDVEQTVRIPPGGSQSASGDQELTTRIGAADEAAAEPNSTGAAAAETAPAAPDSWWRSAPSGFPPAPPAESGAPQSESLSWADDPIVRALTPKTPAPQPKPEVKRSYRKIGVIAGGAVVLLVVIGLVVFAVLRGGKDSAPVAGVTTTGKVPSTVAALSCPSKHDGPLTIGNGSGGTGSGVDAILGFEHAFYVERSGSLARSFVVPESTTVMPADVIQQKGIDPLKAGTTYCLKIVESGKSPDQAQQFYDVDITEHRADGTTEVYTERVTTVERDGKHLIQSIE
ncbi:hypothetical protein ACFXHA_41775 [Nocardia sp. NPDC059240]|uniref:hypothetical protein n=1 Tax=Nocardia sp. NPDC059240 TaxID=3346786 RepID=UPI00368F2B7F